MSSEDSWLLGVRYPQQQAEHSSDVASLIWLTYRSGFSKLEPYALTDDAGWGCMLRSAQMVMAHGLQRHWLGRHWRVPRELAARRRMPTYCLLLELFRDEPGLRSLFSIHNMCQVGMRYDKMPGEWYGPSTAALILRDLAGLLGKGGSEGVDFDLLAGSGTGAAAAAAGGRRQLRVHVTSCDTIYADQVEKLANSGGRGGKTGSSGHRRAGSSNSPVRAPPAQTGSTAASAAAECVQCGGETPSTSAASAASAAGTASAADNGKSSAHKKGSENGWSSATKVSQQRAASSAEQEGGVVPFHDPLLNPPRVLEGPAGEVWSSSVMILVPLRLGIDELHKGYADGLLETLRFPQSLGVIGGRPNHAIYFVGSQGNTLLGLDPHTTQPAADPGDEWLTEAFMKTVHCAQPVTMAVSGVDPSLAVGFYCRDGADFADLVARIHQLSAGGKLAPLSVAQTSPDYAAAADLSSLASTVVDTDGEEDEDDYILV